MVKPVTFKGTTAAGTAAGVTNSLVSVWPDRLDIEYVTVMRGQAKDSVSIPAGDITEVEIIRQALQKPQVLVRTANYGNRGFHLVKAEEAERARQVLLHIRDRAHQQTGPPVARPEASYDGNAHQQSVTPVPAPALPRSYDGYARDRKGEKLKCTVTVGWDRIVVERFGMLFKSSKGGETILTSNIASVDVEKSIMWVRFRVVGSGNSLDFELIKSSESTECERLILMAMEKAQTRSAPPVQAPAPAGGGLAAQLSELAGLHQAGVLTDDEFAAAKARLLGS